MNEILNTKKDEKIFCTCSIQETKHVLFIFVIFKMFFFNSSKKNKTQDKNYDKANELFTQISTDYKKMTSTIQTLIKNLQNLSENVTKLCEDTNGWFIEAPLEKKDESVQFVSFSRGFDVQVFNKFIPGIEEIVLPPLFEFEKDVENIKAVKSSRSKARKSYDNARANQKSKPEDVNQLKENYETLNKQFIDSVNALAKLRPKKLDEAFNDFLALYTSFIRNTFDGVNSLTENMSDQEKNLFINEDLEANEKIF